jgi:hypothetical protein
MEVKFITEELIIPSDIHKIIIEHEYVKGRLLCFIENKIDKFKNCICGAEESYKNCCHKILEISGQKQYQYKEAKKLIIKK